MDRWGRWSRKKQSHKYFSKKKEDHREEIKGAIEEFLKEGKEVERPRYVVYEEYINSDDWKVKKRKEARGRLGSKCEICSTTKRLQLHHNNYATLKEEDVEKDLALVCRSCHGKFHEVIKATKMTKTPGNDTCNMCCAPSCCSYKTEKREFKLCKRCYKIFHHKLRSKKVKFKGEKPKIKRRKRRKKKKPEKTSQKSVAPIVRRKRVP